MRGALSFRVGSCGFITGAVSVDVEGAEDFLDHAQRPLVAKLAAHCLVELHVVDVAVEIVVIVEELEQIRHVPAALGEQRLQLGLHAGRIYRSDRPAAGVDRRRH